jgi:hypothetical protein
MIRLFCLLIIIARSLLRSGAEGLVVFRPLEAHVLPCTVTPELPSAGTHVFGEVVGFDFRRNDQTKVNKVRFERNRLE